jgi:hypothetical protein
VTGQVLRRRRPGVPPYEVAAAEPPERLVAALVRNLAEGVGGQTAYAVPADAGHVVVESWPSGLLAVVDAAGEEPVAGGGAVSVIAPSRWDDAARAMLRDTAVWLGVAVRLTRQRTDRDAADLRARRLRGELTTARARLDRVRDLERHRLVRAITATTLRDLDEVRTRLRAAGADLGDVRDALDELIDDFRVVVRGVFPAMLPDRGPRAALEELAATLPRPVSFAGDLGRRTGWQLESGFYHAVAAALNLLAGKESPHPMTVVFGCDDALRARISAVGALTAAQLHTALGQDMERVAVLGGDMVCTVVDRTAVITVRLAERIEPVAAQAADPATFERSAIHRQVRDLVRQGQEATEGKPARASWDVVAERLTMPVRLAVVGPGTAPPSAPGVSVLAVDAPADRVLAEEFLAESGPRGGVAAVLCRTVPTPEFRTALRGGRHRVALTESGQEEFASHLTAVVAALSARAPVITARRAVTTMTDLVRGLPHDHHLRWAVDRIGADTHEFAELDLLDDLTCGVVLRGLTTAATRLLGADGMDPRARLGLLPTTTDDQVATAARDAITRWRAHGEHPAVGGRDRAACEVLVRTAEGLLPR